MLLFAGVALGSLAVAFLASGASTVVVLTETQRKEITTVARPEGEMLAVDSLARDLGITVASDASGGGVTLRKGRHEVALYARKSLASVDGDLRLLSAPAVLDNGQWLIAVDSIPRVLGPLLEQKAEWRPIPRVLVLGNVVVPRVTVTSWVSGEVVRLVFEASAKVPFRVDQGDGRIVVNVPRDVLDVTFQQEKLTGGIVESVQFAGGRDNAFVITLGRRFQTVKATEQDGPPRLVLELVGSALPVRPPTPAPPAAGVAPHPTASSLPPVAPRVVVIDPGHGGTDHGAKGPSGTLEKDVTLALARRLKSQLVNSLGLQVFLTRDRDEDVPLDQRTAVSNNYKADLFISIHANAHRSRAAYGSEVYFLAWQATDDETTWMAQSEGAASTPMSPVQGAAPASDISLILWDMAQTEHLQESSLLASRIQEEIAVVTGSEGRGVKQAPFRVLVGAAMPAVLVEIAFISNPEEEKLLVSEAFQTKAAAALSHGISRFLGQLDARTTSR